MSDKPPWIARNERERQDMIGWMNEKLDQGCGWPGLSPEHAARLSPDGFADGLERYHQWRREGGPELDAAQRGDIGPARETVRKTYPLLADLLQPPKLKRGEKYLPYTIGEGVIHRPDVRFGELLREVEHRKLIAAAVADVKRIKRIWQDRYGRTYRRQDQVSAIEIAAERHGVTVDEAAERLKRTTK